MEHKHTPVAAVSKDSAAKFSNIAGRLYPAFGRGIKFPKFLQLSILVFIQNLDTHSGCEIHGVTGWENPFLFPFFLRLSVITDTSAALGTLS